MALGTSAIITETTLVVKQIVKTLCHRTRAPLDLEDGLGQALLDGETEGRYEVEDEYTRTDTEATVRTKSWV